MFKIELQVRDYECDMQGIVNNAVYQNYFEHCRHIFLQEKGFNFFNCIGSDILLVVYRAEIDYLLSLKNNQKFIVSAEFKKISKLRCIFYQEISIDNIVFTKANFFVTAIDNNRRPISLDKINFYSIMN